MSGSAGRVLGQPAIFDLADDADDRQPRVGRRQPAELDPLADRILSGPEALHHALADDDRRRRGGHLGLGERAPRDERNAQRAEELGRDAVRVAARIVLGVQLRLAFGGESVALALPSSGRSVPSAASLTPGTARIRSSSARPRITGSGGGCVVPGARRGRRRGCPRNADAQRQHRRRIEAGVERHQVPDGADHEARADEEHDRHRQLGDDQHAAKPLRARPSLPRAVSLSALLRSTERACKPGDEADEQAAGQRDRHREHRDADVEPRRHETRERHRALRDEQGDRAAGEQQAGDGAERRQHAALRNQLTQQPAAPGADRRADGNLAPARFRSGDQQVRDVGARDQQDERDRRHQRQQRGTQRAEQLDVERADLDAALLVGIGIRALELSGDPVDLGLRRRHRDAGLEPRQRREPAIAAAVHRLRRRLDGERDPQLRGVAEALEARRHHADRRCRRARSA